MILFISQWKIWITRWRWIVSVHFDLMLFIVNSENHTRVVSMYDVHMCVCLGGLSIHSNIKIEVGSWINIELKICHIKQLSISNGTTRVYHYEQETWNGKTEHNNIIYDLWWIDYNMLICPKVESISIVSIRLCVCFSNCKCTSVILH